MDQVKARGKGKKDGQDKGRSGVGRTRETREGERKEQKNG